MKFNRVTGKIIYLGRYLFLKCLTINNLQPYLLLIFILFNLLLLPCQVESFQASRRIQTKQQPSGHSLKVRLWGTEIHHGWETKDGYTIVKKNTNGTWVYAELGKDGSLVPGDHLAHKKPPQRLKKHLRPEHSNNKQSGYSGSSNNKKSPLRSISVSQTSNCSPLSGTMPIPVILMNFNNTDTSYQTADFNEILFSDTSSLVTGPGSLKKYFEEVSYGNFSVSSGPAGISGWHTANRGHDYYGKEPFDIGSRARKLAREAVLKSDTNIDYSEYDWDGDSTVSVVIVHQGRGEHETGFDTDIWAHKSFLNVKLDGITIDKYTIQPETITDSQYLQTIGIFAHELGHVLGLPDLYDVDNTTFGIGDWGLMGTGGSNSIQLPNDAPAHLSSWSKTKLCWLKPKKFPTTSTQKKIGPIEKDPTAYFAPETQEYFLIENRQQIGFDTGLPGEGLLIWHNNDRAQSNRSEFSFRLTELIQADGENELEALENLGDNGDPFPGSENIRNFSPNSKRSPTYDDGSEARIRIMDIQESADTITASLSYKDFSNKDGVGACVIPQITSNKDVLEGLRTTRDKLLQIKIGRILTNLYYTLINFIP